MNRKIMEELGFDKQLKNVENGLCATCGKSVAKNTFRNAISRREFKISGMCQDCQDKIFGED